MEFSAWLGVLAVFALVAANGFFVAGEFALVKVRATRVEQLASEGNAVARILQGETTHLDNYIAATQLGITLASLALGWVGEPSLAHLIEPLFGWVGTTAAVGIAESIAVVVSFIAITAFHIVLGELVPKSIALQRTERVALFVAAPLLVFARVFRPFVMLLNGAGNAAVRLLGLPPTSEGESSVHSVEELEMLVSQSREAGVLEPEEETLLHHVFDFSDKLVRDVMTPRTSIVAADIDTSLDEIVRVVEESGYSRIPVYEGTLDNVRGILYAKDLLPVRAQAAPDVRALLHPAVFVLPHQHVDDILTTFRQRGTHLGLVVDEYGQIDGLITLEDVLEELVGEIRDEFDVGEDVGDGALISRTDGSWLADGTMHFEELRERLHLPEPEPDEANRYTTVAGYLLQRFQRIPRPGDALEAEGYRFEVVDMDGRRIDKVLIRAVPGNGEGEAGD